MKPIISFCSRSVKSWPYHQPLLPSLHLLSSSAPLILKRFAFEEREFHLLTEIISCQVTIKGRDRKFLKAMQKVVGIRRFLSPIIPEILGRRSFVIHHFFSKANHHRKYKTPKSKSKIFLREKIDKRGENPCIELIEPQVFTNDGMYTVVIVGRS